MSIWYASREAVQLELDSKTTARMNPRIGRALASASRTIESLTHRTFYPWTGTRYFDWPNAQTAQTGRLWLDENELISATTVVSGGTTIAPADYFLEPNTTGPPFDRLELNRGGTASFGGGLTAQRNIAITGVYGYDLNESASGSLTGSITSSQTTITVTDGSNIHAGSLLRIDSERMTVTERANVTSAQTLQTPLLSSAANDQVVVTTGSAFFVNEVVTLDSERMLIVDIIGNTLTVKRAWDGTVLAAHTGSTVYVSRLFTVSRGQVGTTAATHTATTIQRHVFPSLVSEACVAFAALDIEQGLGGWTGSAGSGDNSRSLRDATAQLRRDLVSAYGRRARTMAV